MSKLTSHAQRRPPTPVTLQVVGDQGWKASSNSCFGSFFFKEENSPGHRAEDSALQLNSARKQVALIYVYQKTACLWPLFLLKVKIPLPKGKTSHKKMKSPTEKAHGFLFIIWGKEFHTDSTHIWKRTSYSEADVFPFPISVNFFRLPLSYLEVVSLKYV